MTLFSRKFFNPDLTAFGLDLSDLSLKIAQLIKENNGLVLANYGRQEIPGGIIEGGIIKKPDELVQIVKKGVREVRGLPLGTEYCVVSLPETESFISVIQMPKMDKGELAEAISWEIENHIPFAVEEVYFDWQIVSSTKEKNNVLLGVMRKDLVDPYLDVLKKAGLKPIVFEIEPIATARSLIKNEFSTEPILIVDFGARRSSFFIFFGCAIYFTASLAISNEYLLDEIKKNLKVGNNEARRLKFEIGLDKEKEGGRVYNALLPALAELVKQIKKCLEFYKTHGPASSEDGKTGKVILCGGGANLIGLSAFLTKELKIPVEVGNPWTNILSNRPEHIPELPYEQSIGYATVLGLALRGIRESESYR